MATSYERSWEVRRKGGRTSGDEAKASYYGIPPIHKPHWKWLVIVYFFLGGIAGASYVVATIARLFGGTEGQRIARVGHFVSLAALLPSPVLLILDLGRPERFHHMLRVFKWRSPMSVGTWGLTVFGGFCTAAAAIETVEAGIVNRPRVVVRIVRLLPTGLIYLVGSGPAFFVSGYTGVLLAATAVPIWTKQHLMMGPLFVSSAMSNATAAITLVLALTRGTTHGTLQRLERLDAISMLSELLILVTLRRRLGPVIGRPLDEGRLGQIHRFGVLGGGLIVPLALQGLAMAMRGRVARGLTIVASIMTLTGGFLFRYVIVMAGHESADDPEATFELTRSDR